MKIAAINLGNFGSTGRIMKSVGQVAKEAGNEYVCVYPMTRLVKDVQPDDIIVCSLLSRKLAETAAYLTGLRGVWLYFSTLRTVRRIGKMPPDIIQLHNLHDTYIHLPVLFRYIKKHDVKVVWTLHDCWSFTGQCPHFTLAACDKWKTGCHDCPQIGVYPPAAVDRTRSMWKLKKKWFTGVRDMTIVTPSQWLADLVGQSYLRDYPVRVVNNGVDLSVFRPTQSDFRQRYGLEGKKILLGVAFSWGRQKGLDVFIELAKRLDSGRFQIVLVGTNETVDKQLPPGMISIHRTQDQRELAQIYTAADLFVNPTREEVLGLVNVEALACGTPVLTFRTGGSPECIDEKCGSVVERDDIDALEKEIIRISEQAPYSAQDCLKRAQAFDQRQKYEAYLDIYRSAGDSSVQ